MGGYKIPRLSVELTDRQLKEQVESSEVKNKEAGKRMCELRDRVLAQPAQSNNLNAFSLILFSLHSLVHFLMPLI